MKARAFVAVLASVTVTAGMPGAVEGSGSASSWTLRIVAAGNRDLAFISLDPAQAPFPTTGLLWSTCAFLYNYPDAAAPAGSVLRPEVAAAFPTMRRSGRNFSYTIRVRRGFRYSTGRPVTAADFVYAIHRDLEPSMQPSTAPDVLRDLVSATSHGDTIVITMRRRAVDLPAMLSSPLFCAIPAGLPAQPNQMAPMAGPYYIASSTQSEVVLKRNPYYRGSRPRKAAEIDWILQVPLDAISLKVERGEAEQGIVSPAATAEIAAKYGVNKSQYFVAPGYQVFCLALNLSRPLFADNPQLRRAVNFAIDRHALVAAFGGYVGRRTDQFLPYSMPGFIHEDVYPLKGPNLKTARALARGHTRSGTAVMFVRGPSLSASSRAQIVQYDLKQIGINVLIQPWSPEQNTTLSNRGAPFDIADRGCGDSAAYLDPYALLNVPFDGSRIRASGNANLSYLNDRALNQKLEKAAGLTGAARYRAYGRLDVELSRDVAPAVPYTVINRWAFVSKSIGCVKLNPIYGTSVGALCLKGS